VVARHGNSARRRPTLIAWSVVLVVLVAVGAIALKSLQSPTSDRAIIARPAQPSPRLSSGAGVPTNGATTPQAASISHHVIAPAAVRVESMPADVNAQVAALTAGVGVSGVSIAALNMTTGANYTYGAKGGMNTGSVVKLDILETLLLQHQDAHTQLTSTEVTEATRMVENSDNNAAQAMWVDIGSDPAVTIANKRLGPEHTIAGTNDYWGLTTTDGTDQVALLKNLVGTDGPLTAASKSFALGLMDNVEADQRWGVGVVADPGTVFANKDGWLAVDDDNDLWLINSDGIVTVHGQQVLISVLTQHDASEGAGIALVQALAKAVTPAVTP
jgi:hypothetical protein